MAGDTRRPGVHGLPTFLHRKKKRETKGKRKSFKAETFKRLSPRSKCYCFSLLKRVDFQNISFRLTMVAENTFQCCLAPPLWLLVEILCFFCLLTSRINLMQWTTITCVNYKITFITIITINFNGLSISTWRRISR